MVTFPQTCGWQKPFHCLVYVRAPFRLLWIKSLYLWSSKDWCFSWGSTDVYTSDTVGNVVYEKFLFKQNQHLEICTVSFVSLEWYSLFRGLEQDSGIIPWLIYPYQYFYWAHQHNNFIRCAELFIQLSIIAINQRFLWIFQWIYN